MDFRHALPKQEGGGRRQRICKQQLYVCRSPEERKIIRKLGCGRRHEMWGCVTRLGLASYTRLIGRLINDDNLASSPRFPRPNSLLRWSELKSCGVLTQ